MKKTGLWLSVLICMFVSSAVFSQGNNPGKGTLLSETKKLQELKIKGKITEEEFQKRKAELIKANFETAEDRKRQEELAKAAAEASRTQAIADEKKRQDDLVRANAEYGVKFPLHAAVKSQDKDKLKTLLQGPNIEINGFDDSGKTAFDIAYEIKMATMSFELCNLLKSSGGVPSEEIRKFAAEKAKANLVRLKVSAGVSYSYGGYQPFVGGDMALVKSSAKPKVVGEAQACLNIFNFVVKGSMEFWGAARAKLMTPVASFVDSDSLVKKASTDSSGKVVFEDVEPGSYLVVFGGPTRKNFCLWVVEVSCTEKETELALTESNALYAE